MGPSSLLLGFLLSASIHAKPLGIDHARLQGRTTGSDILSFIDPLIGTAGGGHVFAGASLPYGMAKAVADVNDENQGGFSSGIGNITGFSHMHDSGTGGSPSLGNFPLFPQAGCPNDDFYQCKFTLTDRATPRVNSSIVATPGYFAINMTSQIKSEMTVSNHTALYRFTFPNQPVEKNSTLSPLILADLIDLPLSRSNASINVDSASGRLTGTGTFNPSFGVGSYDLHFCADFQGASIRDTGVFINDRPGSQPKNLSVYPDGIDVSPQILPAGAWVRFNVPSNNSILARVGVSFISINQACNSAEKEVPDFDFEALHTAARQAWTDSLGVVDIVPGGASTDLQTIFFSGLYRNFISPQDYTGENPLWVSDQPYYDSLYCIWDSFRSIHSLITITDPISQTRMMQSLIEIYVQEGHLPDCRMSLCKGFTQGGSNADVLLSDFFVKNVSNPSIDWPTAYRAVLADAELEPQIWSVEGRGGLTSWKNLHYIPADDFDPYGVGPFTRSISRTVEYAYNDFCVSLLAASYGTPSDVLKYQVRSSYWSNLFDPTSQSSIPNPQDNTTTIPTGFTGYLQPRYLNGTFGYQDPAFCSPLLNFTSCYLNPDGHETYEGSSWLYTFFAPHDMQTLISTLGGDAQFVARLDYLHDSGLLYIGDEQAFLMVYLYHFAGRPGLSAQRVHSYIPSQFNTSINGLAGNDDSGAMGSFIALSMMGTFPNPGQNVYFITPPFFEEVSVRNKLNGNVATIRSVNFDGGTGNGTGEAAGYKNVYIQNATLDGVPYTRNWIGHEFYNQGGVLELVLGPEESAWGTEPVERPPSLPLRVGLSSRDTGMGMDMGVDLGMNERGLELEIVS